MLEFKEIIGLYPYASVFAIAYLRGLKKMEHIQFEEELLAYNAMFMGYQV